MERDLHSNVKSTLLNNTPFVYAHLIKFERPNMTGNLSKTKPSTNKEHYTYLTDASIDISFNDGSKNNAGAPNGAMTYRAQKVLSVGAYSETIDAKATNMNLVVDSTALDASVTADTFEFSGATIITTGDDFLSLGFREGDKITITGATTAANNTSVNIIKFTNNNKTITVEASDADTTFSSFTAQDDSADVTIKVVSPEIQGPLFNNPGAEVIAPAYANRIVFIYKAFLDPDDYTIIGAPNLVFKGFINSTQIKENPERDSKVTWQLTSHWGDFNLVGGRSTNNTSHRALNSEGYVEPSALLRPQYAYDLGFIHGDISLSTMARYATQETRQKLASKKSGLLRRRKYRLVDEHYTKAHEVDLKIDIQSERLPVIYGVQFLEEPIPVFADTNKVLTGGSTVIYRIDALCEGEIQGIYDFHIEDQPRVCINAGDLDDRGHGNTNPDSGMVCFGDATRGHTLGSAAYENIQHAIAEFSSQTHDYHASAGAFTPDGITVNVEGVPNTWWANTMIQSATKMAMHSILQGDEPSGVDTNTSSGRGITDGRIHRGDDPNNFKIAVKNGSSHQEAHIKFVALAKNRDFKRQTDYWESDKYSYWGPNHRLLDTAYAAIECTVNADESQIPDIKYVVKGKKVECFNYDYSYEPVGTSQNNHGQFDFGDTVDIVHITTGTVYVTSAMIIDKFSHFDDTTEIHRFRFGNNLGEPIDISAQIGTATQFRMKKGSEYWSMQLYNHKEQEDQNLGGTLSVDATAIAGTGSGSVVYTVASVPAWLTSDTEVLLHPKASASDATSTFKTEPIYAVTVSGTSITLKHTENADAFRTIHSISGSDELPRLVASRKIQLQSSLSDTAGTYDGKKLILYRNSPSGVMIQERVITNYIGGSTSIAEVSVPWDNGFAPNVYNFRTTGWDNTPDKYDMQNNLRDARVTINPSMQLLDYMTGIYGKNLDLEDDIDLPAFQLAGRTCDTQSDIILESTTAINVTAGDVYQKFDEASPAKLVWQGQIKTTSDSPTTKLVFTNCIGKLNRVWDNYTNYPKGRIIKYNDLVYKTNDSGQITTVTTSNTTLLSNFTLAKEVGSGPSTITANADSAYKIKYSLYDADDVKYWRYFGWESRDQRWVTRHQLNATVDTKISVFQNVNSFLQQFNGILSYQSGKYSLSVATQTDLISSNVSGGYEQNARYITNEDIIGSVNVKDAGPKKSFNSVEATISDPAIKWGDRQVSFYDSNYLKADRSVKKEGKILVSGITNYQNARISVENYLRKSRFGLSVTFTMGPKGLILLAGDTIKLTYDRFSWSEKIFRITNLQFKQDCTVQVSAHEYDNSMYTITGPTAIDIDNLDNKPGLTPDIGSPVAPLGVQTATNGIKITWNRHANASANTVTEIWMRVGTNNRSGATLIHTTGGAETSYTHYETSETGTHYFWVRHKRALIGSQGISTNVITAKYSDYLPTSATGGIAGTITLQSSGTNSKSVKLEPNKHVLVYDEDDDENPATTFTFNTSVQNIPGSPYYEFLVNGNAPAGGAVNTNSLPDPHFTLPQSNEPSIGGTTTVSVKVREGSTTSAVVATDSLTLYAVQDGADAVTTFLTNAAHTVQAPASGVVSSFSGAGGNCKVFKGSTEITSACGFSIQNATAGLTMAVDGNGAYTVSALTATSATASVRVSIPATHVSGDNAVLIDNTYSISKSIAGTAGRSVHLTSTDYSIVYDSAGNTPSFTPSPENNAKIRISASEHGYESPRYQFKLTTGGSTSTLQAFSETDTYDYTIPTSLSSFGTTKVFTLEAREGDSGPATSTDKISVFGIQTGSQGNSVAELLIYREYSAAANWTLTTPTGGSYNFNTSTLTPPTDWQTAPTAGGRTNIRYVSKGIAQAAPTATDTSITWSAPIIDNLLDTIDIIFRRSATNPGAPNPTAAGANVPNWYTNVSSVPNSIHPLWSTQGSPGDVTFDVGSGEHSMVITWQNPTQLEGLDAHTGFLTNASHTVAAEEDGTGYSLTNAGGTFERFKGGTDLTGANTTYAITGGTNTGNPTKTQNGLTFTIAQATGVYTISGGSWTSDSETFTVTATSDTVAVSNKYSISKSKGGSGAYDVEFQSNAVVLPASSTGAVSSFSGSGQVIKVSKAGTALSAVTGTPSTGQFGVSRSFSGISGGTQTASGTTMTFANASTMANGTDTATITYTINCENKVDIVRKQEFSKSKKGDEGIRSETFLIYKTAASSGTPSTPSATSYTFSTGAFVSLTSGWSKNAPSIAGANANNFWYVRVFAVENSSGTNSSSGSNLSFVAPERRFTGVGDTFSLDTTDFAFDYGGSNENARLMINNAAVSTVPAPDSIKNPPFTTGTSFPSSPKDGQVFYNTSTKRLYKYKL